MSRSLPALRPSGALAVVAALVSLVVLGCATKTVAPPAADTPPPASSAENAVRRFDWALNHHGVDVVEGLLADDFQFVGAAMDSSGNASPDTVGDRSWLDLALRAMLDPSNQVSLRIDENLIPYPDSRPGRDPRWHRQVRTSIDLRVRDPQANSEFQVSGHALFFLTRGDSAAIPQVLMDRGVKPDSAAWWFDRVEDETLAPGASPAATNPTIMPTLTSILGYYYSRLMK